MAKLRLIKDGVEIRSLDLNETGKTSLLIGRAEGCDLRIDDRAVGREHAVLSVRGDVLSIRKKSKFGVVSVNGLETAEASVKVGDIISIADYRLEVNESEAAAREVAAAFEPSPGLSVGEPAGAPPLEPSVMLESSSFATPSEAPSEAAVEAEAAIEPPAAPGLALETGSGAPISKRETASLGARAEPSPESGGSSKSGFKLEAATSIFDAASPPASGIVTSEPIALSGSGFQVADGGEHTAIISHAKLDASLVFRTGEANVDDYRIEKAEISIGRGSDCDVVLGDRTASRKHLLIRRVGATFVAQDLGSGNGTLVNGERITQRELSGDDVLKIGDTEFTFKAVSAEYLRQQEGFMAVPAEEPAAAPAAYAPAPSEGLGAMAGGMQPQQGEAAGYPGHAGGPQLTGSFSGVPGIGGAKKSGRESLLAKFKRQPRMRQIIILAGIFAVGAFLFTNEDDTKKKKPAATQGLVRKEDEAFQKLPEEKKQFVVNTYQLAYDLFKNTEYERALFEVKKVLDVIPNGYKDAKDIKRYAENAIEMERTKAEEKRRKEEAARIQKEVADLLVQAQEFVDKGKDSEAREVFVRVFEFDPENATALRLKQQLDEKAERAKRDEEERANIAEKRGKLLELIGEGRKLLAKGKYYAVMDRMQDAPTIGLNDPKLMGQARALIVRAKTELKNKAQPFVDEGTRELAAGNYPRARDAFYKALKIDYKQKQALAGIERIREELHRRAQAIYTEGVIAESVSDFETAKARFKECLEQSMPDDVYYGRCLRKSRRFQLTDELAGREAGGRSAASQAAPSGESGAAGGDPEMPVLGKPETGESNE
ncbi:MAG: FHA domain-containing protein [Deltaproteobacteria bacterium]|nr:FHA domain-containing protein [Deltaproteobacteria bacterium]